MKMRVKDSIEHSFGGMVGERHGEVGSRAYPVRLRLENGERVEFRKKKLNPLMNLNPAAPPRTPRSSLSPSGTTGRVSYWVGGRRRCQRQYLGQTGFPHKESSWIVRGKS